jgi:hypothetical protein
MPDISWHEILAGASRPSSSSSSSSSSSERDGELEGNAAPPQQREPPRAEPPRSDLKPASSGNRPEPLATTRPDATFGPDLLDFHSVQVVSKLSCQLVEEVLHGLCNEMITSDILSKLIADELKG